MRQLAIFLILTAYPAVRTGLAQTPSQTEASPTELATRMLQLMESTAVVVPGLIEASAPVKQSAQSTFAALQRTRRSPALMYRFMSQMRAYAALADSMPRPNNFPPTADAQFAELREDLQRMQQYFETILQAENQEAQQKDSDPNDLKHYAAVNAKVPAPGAIPRVVFLGDETTEVWRLNEYFTGRDFINRGITGQTTQQMLGRFRQDVLGLKPKVVVILGGSADVAGGIDLKQTEDNLATMGDLARAAGIKAVFASVLPVNSYHKDQDPKYDTASARPPATIAAINRWMDGYCGNPAAGCIYLNYHPGLVDTSGMMQASLSDDGLVPNAKGLRAMSPLALDAIGRALTSLGEPPLPDAQKKRSRFLPGLPK